MNDQTALWLPHLDAAAGSGLLAAYPQFKRCQVLYNSDLQQLRIALTGPKGTKSFEVIANHIPPLTMDGYKKAVAEKVVADIRKALDNK